MPRPTPWRKRMGAVEEGSTSPLSVIGGEEGEGEREREPVFFFVVSPSPRFAVGEEREKRKKKKGRGAGRGQSFCLLVALVETLPIRARRGREVSGVRPLLCCAQAAAGQPPPPKRERAEVRLSLGREGARAPEQQRRSPPPPPHSFDCRPFSSDYASSTRGRRFLILRQ